MAMVKPAQWTRKKLIAAAKAAARGAGDRGLSLAQFESKTGISGHFVGRLFPGRWDELAVAAGITRSKYYKLRYSDDDLLVKYDRVATDLGRWPSYREFERGAMVSGSLMQKRFGGRAELRARYREWRTANGRGAPAWVGYGSDRKDRNPNWLSTDGKKLLRPLGQPMTTSRMGYAPTNELGVIFLFGSLCADLGFHVEEIHAGFPDCIATRLVNRARGEWRRLRIEFEFRSANFRTHGHNPAGCDLIVCWHHDWPDCPVEVVELRCLAPSESGQFRRSGCA